MSTDTNNIRNGLDSKIRNAIGCTIPPNADSFNWFNKATYNEEAEENAHSFLKTMVTDKEFNTYKYDGYLKIKGTYGRSYMIKKNDTIKVTQKIKGKKLKEYQLCIEPRDRGSVCPTDEVIAKFKLIKSDERRLHAIATRFDKKFNAINNASLESSLGY